MRILDKKKRFPEFSIMGSTPLWGSFIDKIVYINLDKRTDRRAQIERELETASIPPECIERFPAVERSSGILGCSLSHLEVLRRARAEGWAQVLILEDDFEFVVSPQEVVDALKELAASDLFYDVCFLAYRIHDSESLPTTDLLRRALFSKTASAYLVRSHYYPVLIELYERSTVLLEATGIHWEYANDIVWKDLQRRDRWLYFSRRLGKQRPGYSDNSLQFVDIPW